jgi:hypothetical protein
MGPIWRRTAIPHQPSSAAVRQHRPFRQADLLASPIFEGRNPTSYHELDATTCGLQGIAGSYALVIAHWSTKGSAALISPSLPNQKLVVNRVENGTGDRWRASVQYRAGNLASLLASTQ